MSDGNWIQTMLGKGWNTIMRLYVERQNVYRTQQEGC